MVCACASIMLSTNKNLALTHLFDRHCNVDLRQHAYAGFCPILVVPLASCRLEMDGLG